MLTINTDRTNMIRTSCTYCAAHAAETAAITDFAPTVTKVKNKLVLIDALNTIATGTSKGVTLDTNAIRKVMEVDTDKVCSGLKALAGDTNNNTMYEAANYTEAKLSKLRKDEVDDICEGIYNLALTNKIALVPKGIVTADITDTLTAIYDKILMYRNSPFLYTTKFSCILNISFLYMMKTLCTRNHDIGYISELYGQGKLIWDFLLKNFARRHGENTENFFPQLFDFRERITLCLLNLLVKTHRQGHWVQHQQTKKNILEWK